MIEVSEICFNLMLNMLMMVMELIMINGMLVVIMSEVCSLRNKKIMIIMIMIVEIILLMMLLIFVFMLFESLEIG